jgi:transitional endoplasmic reticulum ATPase
MSAKAASQKDTPSPAGPSLFPDWFRTYIDLYEAEVAHGFLLCGDLWGVTTRNLPQREFLQQALATRREIIAVYDTARGITFPKPEMREKARRLLTQEAEVPPADPVRAALASAGALVQPAGDVFSLAREPLDALAVLDRLLRAPGGRNRIAVLVDFLDTLCPRAEAKATMSEQDRRLLVSLLSWGQDQDLARCDNPIFLLARDASEVHADLRAAGSGYALIEIPRPDLTERRSYLSWYLEARKEQGRPVTLTDLSVDLLANLTAGLNLRDIENVVLQADWAGGVTRALVKQAKAEIIEREYTDCAEVLDPLEGGFAALGGIDYLVSWARKELIEPLSEGRASAPKGVLLAGPPGTGKTLFARALAKEAGFNAVALKPENILGRYVGQSEAALKRFFDFARSLTPVLVFLDEVDQSDLSRRGTGSGNPTAANLFGQMLRFLSDESLRGKMVMVLASNRPDLLDSALLRFGRMDAIIPILLPDEAARRSILEVQARSQGVLVDEKALDLLVAQSKDYSPADLAAIIDKAKKLSRRADRSRITLVEAERALAYIRPATPQVAGFYTRLAVQACTDSELLPPEYARLLEDRQALAEQIAQEPSSPLRSGRAAW